MQKVGESFGSGKLQLPFVLQSAEVVKKTVDCLTPYMEKKESSADRIMILATVAGDVHDIGKSTKSCFKSCWLTKSISYIPFSINTFTIIS